MAIDYYRGHLMEHVDAGIGSSVLAIGYYRGHLSDGQWNKALGNVVKIFGPIHAHPINRRDILENTHGFHSEDQKEHKTESFHNRAT